MTDSGRKKITVLIPCLNEEQSIGSVIRHIPKKKLETYGYDLAVIVIDNNSRDRTARVASKEGVTVIHEPLQGKGNAIRRGFSHISRDTDYVVMLDGDATYRPEEMLRLVELLDSGFCKVVTGSRLAGRISKGSMRILNRAGNWLFSHLVRQIYQVNVTDALTGYFAWTRDVVEKLKPHLTSRGFAIEMEIITKIARLGEEIYSVPISYDPRIGSTSSLKPFYDGSRILFMLFKNLFWRPTPRRMFRRPFMKPAQEKSG